MEVHKRYPVRRLSLKDEFDFDINDISRASTPTSTMSSKSEGRRRERSHHRSHSIEDYRRKISRLKSELEAEKERTKQVYREKSVEIKTIRDTYNKEKQKEIESLEAKLAEQKKKEIEVLQESIIKKKDKELQQVLRYKEDEIDKLRARFEQERDKAMQTAVKSEKKQFEDNAKKMEEEIKKLKTEKEKMEKEYKKKCEEELKKEKQFSQVKEEYDTELRKILSESKKLAMGNLQKLKKAEKALSEGVISEDEAMSITESLRLTPFSEVSSRTPSRPLAVRMDEFKIEEVEIDKYLASATPSPHPSATTPLGKTYTIDGKSPLTVILQPQESTSNSTSYSEQSGPSKERSQWISKTLPKVRPQLKKNRKVTEEKDRQLQRRIAELQAQTQRLERKIALVKTENETLKRQRDDQKPLEEKIKTLKKRNAELAAIARRLEEKAKHLQQENVKKAREEVNQPESDHLKKMFARQRAKDLAEHAKAMLTKDREIEDLRRKCQELADQLSNADFLGPENVKMYEEKEELVTIIKQAAKERLQLEKQLAKTKPTPTAQAEAKKVKELEATNETLQKELEKLEKAKEDTEKLEIELTQKKIECETLSEEIKKERQRSRDLENDLQESAAYNTQLSVQVSDLQHRLQDLEKVNEECNVLKLNLTAAQHECTVAKGERNVLQTKVDNLEFTVKSLKESAEKLQQLEHEHQSTIQQLQEKHSQIESLQKAQNVAKEEYEEVFQSLQTRIKELQDSCQQQEERHKLLTDQLQTLQAAASKNNFKHSSSHNSSPSKANQNHSNSIQLPIEESIHQSNASLQESVRIANSKDRNQVDSTKSLDTGFADDDETELDNSHDPSPDQGKPPGDHFEDPELYEIAKKLKELEASDSEEDNFQSEDRGEDSGMESQKEHKVKSSATDDNHVSVQTRKGPISVFIAKYSYDPFQHSPNENPDAELPLSSGDYILVYGEMDEDGFFDGELITGRKGLVPSNFIEKVADEDLSEFHAAMAGVNHHDDDSTAGNSIQQDLDFDSSEETEEKVAISLEMKKVLSANDSYGSKSPDSPLERPGNPAALDVSRGDSGGGDISHTPSAQGSDLEDSEISESQKLLNAEKVKAIATETGIPCPQQLTLDRQLTNSILISWKPPESAEKLDIKSYHVYVDNTFKSLVRGNERTKALVENVDIREVHRVSVRCNSNKGQSHDSQCTMLVGKDCVPAPSELKVCDITPNSAHISWLPGNSNYQHSIFVNGQAVRVVKPGVHSHTLTGLVSGSNHKVTVSAKSLRGGSEGENLSASLEFRTLDGGLPEPPVNVQVEAGPQEGTLLLTWLPVTIDTTGISNGAVVTGYVVYADGHKTKEAMGPTNDHIVLCSDDFKGFIPKQLMVRTMTADKKESVNSDVIKLPQSLIKEITEGAAKSVVPSSGKVPQKSPIHHDETDEDIDAAFQKIAEKAERDLSPLIDSIEYEDDFVETSSSSELSDIPEEVEEDTAASEDTNQNSVPEKLSPSLVNGQVASTKGEARLSPKSSSVSNRKSQNTSDNRNEVSPRPRVAPRIVPAIEITRDSSTEVDNSFDVSDDELQYRVHGSKKSEKPSPKINQSNTNDDKQQKHRRSPTDNDTVSNHGNSGLSNKGDSSVSIQQELNDSYGIKQSDINARKNIDSSKKRGSPRDKSDISKIGDQDMSKSQSPKRHLESPRGGDVRTSSDIVSSESPKRRESPHQHSPQSPRRQNIPLHKPNSNSPHKDVTTKDKHISDSNANRVVNNVSPSREEEDTRVPQLDLTEYDESGEVDSISGEINPPVEDNRIRLFVALFDYDPESMSPNVESLEEELPFKEGQIIKIYGDKDPDGFYRGECNGRVGFVPCNMVSEIQVEDPDLADQLLKESQVAFNTHLSDNDNYIKPVELDYKGLQSSPNKITTAVANSNHMRKMIALYDYDPQELSPNVDAELELPFKSGEVLMIYGEMDDDGFYMGELNGQKGLVPSNFLQDVQPSDEDGVENSSVASPTRSGESLNNLSGSRLSDLSVDKTQKLGSNTQMDQLEHDRVPNTVQSQSTNRSGSVSPEDTKQKKKSSSILTKGKNILKKLTR